MWTAGLAFWLGGCAISDDFSVSGDLHQRVSVADSDVIVVRCYCPNREVIYSSNVSYVELHGVGTHSSKGYHGEQEKPRSVSPELLRFSERRTDGRLILESREYTYIHHAFLVDLLRLTAPVGQDVRFEPISPGELEGRQVEKTDS